MTRRKAFGRVLLGTLLLSWLMACTQEPEAPSALTIATPSPLPQGIRGRAYSQQLKADGGQGQLRWSSGNLADDFTLDPARGIVTATAKHDGTKGPGRVGTFTFDVSVTDEEKQCSAKRFQLTVIGLDIVTRDLPPATPGTDYAASVTAEGGILPLKWSLASGALPGGLNLDGQTGTITGKPTSASATPFSFEVTVTDSARPAQSDTQFLQISVQEPGITVHGAAPLVWVIAINGVDQTGTTAEVKSGDSVEWRYRSGVPSHGVGFMEFSQAEEFLTFDLTTGPIEDQSGFGPNARGTAPINNPGGLMLRATILNEPSGTELDFFCTLHGTAMSGKLRMQ